MDVVLSSYSLYAIGKDSGVVMVGEEKFKYSTPNIRIDPEAGKQSTPCTTVTHELTDDELKNGIDVSAKWVFNGVYSSKPIGDIIASTRISFE